MDIKHFKTSIRIGLSILFASLACANAEANDSNDIAKIRPPYGQGTYRTDCWHYTITPYVWFSAINGNYTMQGHRAHAQIPFDDIWKDLTFAGEVDMEARRGLWTLLLDPTYIRLSQNLRTADLFRANLTAQTTVVDAGVYYRILVDADQIPYYDFVGPGVEIYAGVRYMRFDNDLDLKIGPDYSNVTQVGVPMIGARVKYNCCDKLRFWARGDIGGFYVQHVSNTWDISVGTTYKLNKTIDLAFALKVLDINYGVENTKINSLAYGPMLGVAFHF